MNSYYKNLPKKRMGVGALFFNAQGELLILKPAYKDHWSIPGGVINKDESPRQSCIREIKEEIGLNINVKKMLCVDYVSTNNKEDESLQFIFFGGNISQKQIKSIIINKKEISEYKFLKSKDALPLLGKKLSKRIPKCLKALKNKTAVYLENAQ